MTGMLVKKPSHSPAEFLHAYYMPTEGKNLSPNRNNSPHIVKRKSLISKDFWIAFGEEDMIIADQLKKAYHRMKIWTGNKGIWVKAVDQAIELNTMIYMVF